MKIGIICYPTYGGSGVIATELGCNLSRLGHEVHFICYNLPARLTCQPNVYFHLVDVVSYPLFKFPPYTLALASKTAEVIEEYGLDIIHAHYAVPHAMSAHLAQQIVGDTQIKIITTLHGTDIRLVGLEPSYYRATKYAISNNNGLTAVSQYLADITREEFKIDRPIEVIPNFVDNQRFIRKPDAQLRLQYAAPDQKIITHISNFRTVKRIPDILQTFALISQKIPVRLLLVGDGPEINHAAELVNKLRIHHRVHFLNLVNNVEDILSISDLFLLLSETESFGLAALEAMSCEVPVIASRVGGIPEVVQHGECGFLADVGAIEEFARLSLTILQDEVLSAKMGKMGRQIAIERFSSEKVIPLYENYYKRVLAGGI
ncbi:MAG: N-acetyl-alpha-D-glucosaminyl L-malate synthase BshA [Candidatus Schekmanbacteria bacterium]|nr:N-acetyl-alpha-D-glucosaminyl L-malate synthase BshA [Candidatus Schekmanbacteria bacterium]